MLWIPVSNQLKNNLQIAYYFRVFMLDEWEVSMLAYKNAHFSLSRSCLYQNKDLTLVLFWPFWIL